VNTDTGELWPAEEVTEAQRKLEAACDQEKLAEMYAAIEPREKRLVDSINTDRLVMVSNEVAQKVKLGERELNRRERRRRARRT